MKMHLDEVRAWCEEHPDPRVGSEANPSGLYPCDSPFARGTEERCLDCVTCAECLRSLIDRAIGRLKELEQ